MIELAQMRSVHSGNLCSGVFGCAFVLTALTYGFFAKEGFVTANITENWYTESLHRYDMRLTLDDEQHSRIAQTFADLSRKLEA